MRQKLDCYYLHANCTISAYFAVYYISMPLYREWSSDQFSLAAIWHIEEPEDFFIERTGITSNIKHPKRRMEHLAGRFLLRHLKEDFPLLHIAPDEHDKPRLPNNQYYFSISHSYPYVAVVVSPYVECGVDIQVPHPRMLQLQHKFLSESERQLCSGDEQLITLAWSAKEAAYKWQGRRGVEFDEHMIIEKIEKGGDDIIFNISMKLLQLKAPITVKGLSVYAFSFATVLHHTLFHPHE